MVDEQKADTEASESSRADQDTSSDEPGRSESADELTPEDLHGVAGGWSGQDPPCDP